MPKTQSNLLDLVNSDSDDEFASDLDIRPTTIVLKKPAAKTMPAAKSPARGAAAKAKATSKTAPAAIKVTKPAPKKKTASSGRRASGRLAAAVENSDEARAVLTERSSNKQPAPEPKKTTAKSRKAAALREAEMIEDSIVATPPPTTKTKGGRAGRPKKIAGEDLEIPESQPEPPAPKPAPIKRGRKPAAAAARSAEIEIPETQQPEPEDYQTTDAMDLDLTQEDPSELEDLPFSTAPPPTTRVASVPPPSATRKAPYSAGAVRRPLSASTSTTKPSSFLPPLPTTTTDDSVSLRRRIGDLTKSNTSLETRLRDLTSVAVRDAEVNFDRLRAQTDSRAAASAALIESLKTELAAQKELAREGARCKSRLDVAEARVDDLQGQVMDLTLALSEAKTENKNLALKLAAARGNGGGKSVVGAGGVPGSAVKNGVGVGGGVPNGGLSLGKAGGGEEIAGPKASQMKEDLYQDLTSLVVVGLRNVDGEGVFSCIQTGRNGTLEFKLAISADTASADYDKAEYRYMPQLDEGRDAELLDVLPDYLVDEITFPRGHAGRFYARLVRALTEQPADDGE